MDCEGFANLLLTPLEQILSNIWCVSDYLHNKKNGLEEGCVGNKIIRCIKIEILALVCFCSGSFRNSLDFTAFQTSSSLERVS